MGYVVYIGVPGYSPPAESVVFGIFDSSQLQSAGWGGWREIFVKSIEFTGFYEIQCFLENFMIFAKRLPLCQHAKIAMIPKGFHGFWSQLLPKILKKHPEMHFIRFFTKIIEIHIF